MVLNGCTINAEEIKNYHYYYHIINKLVCLFVKLSLLVLAIGLDYGTLGAQFNYNFNQLELTL
jgi:hypothetical protein